MQLITNVTKTVTLAILSWCFLIAWYGNNSIVPSLGSLDIARSFILPPIIQVPRVELPRPVKSTPKPAGNIVKKSTTSLWSTIGYDLQLDHRASSSQVQAEIRKMLAEPRKLKQILEAAGPYIYFIYEQTKQHQLPAEIALIPIIESEFNPNDHSTKGAIGLWQLMRGTARELGVHMTSGYDGRRNVVVSTKAALLYLKDLKTYFKGNWYLALAAYNTGQGKVKSAMRRTGSNSFWQLPLPRETKFYVPKVLAIAAIIKNPEKYGIKLPLINNEPYFIELKLKKSVNLEKVAKASGVSIDTFRLLNPDYKQGYVVPKKGAYSLLIPLHALAAVKAFLSDSIL